MATKSKKKKSRVVVQREYASPYTREEALALTMMFWKCCRELDPPDDILDPAAALMCRICDQAEIMICKKCGLPAYIENLCPSDDEECECE